jgi:hypothetical protein
MAGNMNQSKAQPAPDWEQFMISYIGNMRNSESSVSPPATQVISILLAASAVGVSLLAVRGAPGMPRQRLAGLFRLVVDTLPPRFGMRRKICMEVHGFYTTKLLRLAAKERIDLYVALWHKVMFMSGSYPTQCKTSINRTVFLLCIDGFQIRSPSRFQSNPKPFEAK